MANHSIDRTYSEVLRQLETTDPSHADTFNPLFKQLLNNIANVKDQVTGQVSVVTFGAKGDGVTNDTAAIQAAADKAKADGLALYVPRGTFYCAQDVNIDGVKQIVMDGTIQLAANKVLDIANDSQGGPANWRFYSITGGKLRLSGLNSSIVVVLKAKELELYAHGDIPKKEFIAYNTLTLGKVDKLSFWSEGTKYGWINENRFYGGRIQTIVMDGNYHHDNNVFYGTMLEAFTLNMIKGNGNFFYDVRFEGNNTITFGPGTNDNVMYKTFNDTPFAYLRDNAQINFVNNGYENQIISNLDMTHRRDTLIGIDPKTANYDLSALTRNQSDLSIVGDYKVLYESDIIELKNPMGLTVKSDKSLFFIDVYAYDAAKTLLKTQQAGFTELAGGVFYAGSGSYTFDANMGLLNTGVPLFPTGVVKYIKYKLRTGDSVNGQKFTYLKLVKNETVLNQTEIRTVNDIKRWTHTIMPVKGYWEKGDTVHNSAPAAGGCMGWVCVTKGVANAVAWAATTAYTVGQQVNANNKVYEVTVAGTSGATALSHSTGTAVNGTVTFKYVDTLAVFKEFGLISE